MNTNLNPTNLSSATKAESDQHVAYKASFITEHRPRKQRVKQSDRVYRGLRNRLMGGNFSPFDSLSEERVAELFNVSRTPVREALSKLYSDGLLERRNGSLFFRVPRFEEIEELYEVRMTLERRGFERIIEDPTISHNYELLHTELDHWLEYHHSIPSPDAGFVSEDENFHVTLLKSAGNDEMSALLEQINARIRCVRMYDYLTEKRMLLTVKQHIQIAELTLRGDLVNAEKSLTDHINESREVVMERAANAMVVGSSVGTVRRRDND